MKLLVKKGTVSKLLSVWVPDSASTTGNGKTGIAFNAAGFTAYYYREGAVGATEITLASGTLGTWVSGLWAEVDSTNMPGLYQLGIPDAALATGVNSVVVLLKGASGMAPVVLELQLVDFDPNSATDLGLSRLDAAITTRASSTVDTDATAIKAKTDNLPADPASQAAVLAAVVAALATTTYAEPGAAPPATASLAVKIGWLCAMARNERQETATGVTLKTAGGAGTIATAVVSDDGTTIVQSEWS